MEVRRAALEVGEGVLLGGNRGMAERTTITSQHTAKWPPHSALFNTHYLQQTASSVTSLLCPPTLCTTLTC